MLALGRLLRLSLAPSAAADIAAGIVLAAGTWPAGWRPFALMLASLCVYHGGMALNDWADRVADANTRPGRPIPSGSVPALAALVLAIGLLGAGSLLALVVSARVGACLATVACLAAIYDLRGRGAWLGPLLLGACRAGNLGAGLLFGRGQGSGGGLGALVVSGIPEVPGEYLVALLYGLYVFCVSRVARLEDAEPLVLASARPERGLLLAAFLLALLGLPLTSVLAGSTSSLATACTSAVLALAGALGLARRALQPGPWSAGAVGAAVGMALRRLLMATAALAAQAGTRDGLVVAAAILAGYPVSYLLRRVFPPT